MTLENSSTITGFLWIKGRKPGTGKSTLVKFVFLKAREVKKNTIAISFFFDARGSDLEQSIAGMF